MNWIGFLWLWSGLTINAICVCTIYDNKGQMPLWKKLLIGLMAGVYFPLSAIVYFCALIIVIFEKINKIIKK